MSSNNNRQDNVNRPKVYISPFNKNAKNRYNNNGKTNKQSFINNSNLYGNYRNNINNINNYKDNIKNTYKPNDRNKIKLPNNNVNKNILENPLQSQLQSQLPSNFLDRIESIEIFPMDGTNNSITYKPSDFKPTNLKSTNLKNRDNDNFFQNILKKILFKDLDKQEQKDDTPITPEFVIDINNYYEEITKPIKTLDDLIELGNMYTPEIATKYAINLKRLNKLVEPLTELKNVIGMDTVKNSIIDQIVYFLQAFEENNNMLHTIIEGPPGVGKTMLGYILGKIYFNMGVLKGSNNAINNLTGKKDDFVFKIVKRKDLIGEYLGHTAVKTQKAIDECKGGVLFIDEAYSLGNLDKKDTYSKECIDTINQNLSENKNNFMCIIAGYPEQLEQCFFSYNEGLKRRFTFKYTIEKYNAKELCNIFKKMVLDSKWELDIDDKVLEEFINKNIKEFENFGGDMETLLFRTKITHSKRVFGVHPRNKKKINIDDIVKAFELFKSNKKKEINGLSEEVLRNIYT
jgi:SpoVK/Ycf46/Vps4 family AAA+-type ATPase